MSWGSEVLLESNKVFKGSRKKLRPVYSIVAAGIALLFAVAPGLGVTSVDIGVHATTVEPLDPIQSDAPSSDSAQGAVGDPEPTDEPETTDEVTSETPSPEISTESQTPSPSSESASPEDVRPEGESETFSTSPNDISPLALDDQSCSYADAGSGAYASTLCWIDFSGFTTRYRNDGGPVFNQNWVSVLDPVGGPYTNTVAGSDWNNWGTRWGHVRNVDVEVDLGDGFVLSAQLDTDSTGVATQRSSRAIESDSFPTYQGAFLGSPTGGFYSGVEGEPALYQSLDGGGTSTVTLKNIRVERNGQAMRDYSIVVADAETTDDGEGISWTTNGAGFRWLPNTPPGNTKAEVMGNACSTAEPAWDSTSTPQEALCEANNSSSKTGTPMLATEPPLNPATAFEISQTLSGNGRQGVAFGIIMARASVESKVADRIVDASNIENDPTNFTATVREEADSSLLMSAETGEQDMTSGTVSNVIPVSSDGTRVRYETARTGTFAESYTPAWQCEKTDPSTGATSYWPSETTTSPKPLTAENDEGDFSLLRVGEFLHCTVEYQPPYLSLLKTIENGETDATNTRADFTLHAEGNGSINSAISGPGNAATQLTRRPVAVGQYELSETGPDPDDEGNWPYGYDWSDLQCLPTQENGSINPDDVDITRDHLDNVTEANLQIHEDSDVTCTFTNTAREPRIAASKTAFDDSDTVLDWANPVDGGGTVRYRLTFDNVGTAPMELDHVDYLADVLDDANYVPGSLRIQNGDETSYPDTNMSDAGIEVAEQLTGDNPRLEITGAVDRGEVRTVWFEVGVLANTQDASDRGQNASRSGDDRPEQVGYSLNNYLVPAGEPVPETCEEPQDDTAPTCTHQPIPAWTLDKNSRPADGARLHKGGNTHYQITATKMNTATEIDQLVFTDDLTHVFKTAGWAPDAAVPGGALSRGIYFFDSTGQSLDADGNLVGTVDEPLAAYDADSAQVPDPEYDATDQRWTLTTLPVDVPNNAERAELWFAVEAGQTPVGIPAQWTGSDTPQMGWRYTNYVTAESANLVANQCDAGNTPEPVTGQAPSENPAYDTEFPAACRVTHQLSENYFTIRKDAGGQGIQPTPTEGGWGDSSGLTNMVGHEFEIRDDVDGQPSANPSERLCRTEYDPDQGWDGTFITGGTPDWGEYSETLAAIIDFNNRQEDEADHLPLCALFYPQGTYGGQDHAGGQDGRWRSEQLGEGDYWLVETKAPEEQIDTTGNQTREVTGVQLLAEPVAFTVWPDAPAPTFGDSGQSMEGQGQLDIVGQEQQRCSPGAPVGQRPVACVNPTGYLMIVKDAAPMTLPLTGGQWLKVLTGVGLVVLVGSVAIAWWRRHNFKILNAREGKAGSQ